MKRIALLLSCLALLSHGVAHAQPTPEPAAIRSPGDLARAKELRQQGHQQFDDQRYAEALALYREAHRLSGDPALLYNIGRAHQFLNEAPEALEAFESFLSSASPELKAKVQGLNETVAEVRGKVTTVTFSSNVAGARVLVRKKEVGKTPLKPLRLLSGEAEVEVISDAFEPLSRKVMFKGGEAMTLDLPLAPKKTAGGLLVVRSPIAGARVVVDGRLVGGVPADVLLDPGEHRIAVSAEGHNDKSIAVVMAAGERRELSVELEKKAKPSRWWLWTGVGAVLVGGAVLAFALTTERSADQGTLGQRSVPLLRF